MKSKGGIIGVLGRYRQCNTSGTFYEIGIDTRTKAITELIPYKIFAGEVMRDEDADYFESDTLYKKVREEKQEQVQEAQASESS